MKYKTWKSQINLDKIVVTLWLVYLLINVLSHYIVQWFGGIGTIIFVWFFWVYFQLVYGSKTKGKGRINNTVFVVFTTLFCLAMQFGNLYSSKYESYGVVFNSVVWNMITFFPLILSAVAIIEKSNFEMILWIKKSFIVLLIVTSLFSITFLSIDSSALRTTATSTGIYVPFSVSFQVVAGLAVIYPILIASINVSNKKIFMFVVLLLVMITIVMASFFIAIMTMFLGIVIYFIMKQKSVVVRSLIVILIVCLFFYEAQTSKLATYLIHLADEFSVTEVSRRIHQLILFFNDGTIADTTARITLYRNALSLILQHPITGNLFWDNMTVLSGHSALMDMWGGCGLLVFALFIMYLVSVYRYNTINFSLWGYKKAAYITSFISLLFFTTLNPLFASPCIMIFWIIAPVFMVEKNISEELK